MVLFTSADGAIVDIVNEKDAGDDILSLEGILCPGFINAHCHIELSHMKGLIPQKTGLVEFVQQVIKKRQAGQDEKMAAMQEAEKEMCNDGIVAAGDICNTTDSIELKKKSRLRWHNFIEVTGFVDAVAEKRLAEIEEIACEFQQLSSSNSQPSTIVPHAPYSVSKKLFQLLNEKTENEVISIHNQEAAAENELYQTKTGKFLELYKNLGIDISGFGSTGKTSFQSWLPMFTNQQQIISVHNSFINEADLQSPTINHQPLSFCLCPHANLYIEDRLPPVDMFIKNNCNIVLGTDSLASNQKLSISSEISLILQHFPHIDISAILRWATINGARALRLDKELGSFEKGKTPAVLLLSPFTQAGFTVEKLV